MEKKDHLPTWPEIRDQDPELARRCREGDKDAIIEFVKRALGGTEIK
jgi:hypothetical protein